MGSGGKRRSIRDLFDHYTAQSASSSLADRPPTLSLATLFGWSKRHEWENRVTLADRQLQEAEDASRATIRAERRKQLEDQDFRDGNALREATRAILSELPKFKTRTISHVERTDPLTKVVTITEIIAVALQAGPGELARALEAASKLQRLSVGEATEIHKLVESELGAMLDRLHDNLSPEEYARIVGILAGGATA